MRTVKNILDSKSKAFNIVSPNTLVIDALSMLNSVNLSYLVVMEGEEYKGIFSERDYSRHFPAQYTQWTHARKRCVPEKSVQ